MALDFPNPATQTPVNEFSPTSTPSATTNGVTYTWDGTKWVGAGGGGGGVTPDLQSVTDEGNTTTNDIITTGDVNADNVVATGDINADNVVATGDVNAANVVASGDVQATSFNGGTLGGFRNQIINGDFRIWQRGTANFDNNTGFPMYGSADRWLLGMSTTATFGLVANTGPVGAANSASLAAGVGVQQRFESNNLHFRDGETFTASVWATGIPTISFVDSNNAIFVNAAGVSTGQVSNGFTRYALTWTFAANPTGTFTALGIANLNAGTFNFTGVQVERGPVATPFEDRPIATEMALCQRYCQRLQVRQETGQSIWYSFPTKFRTRPATTTAAVTTILDDVFGLSTSASASLDIIFNAEL